MYRTLFCVIHRKSYSHSKTVRFFLAHPVFRLLCVTRVLMKIFRIRFMDVNLMNVVLCTAVAVAAYIDLDVYMTLRCVDKEPWGNSEACHSMTSSEFCSKIKAIRRSYHKKSRVAVNHNGHVHIVNARTSRLCSVQHPLFTCSSNHWRTPFPVPG